MTEEQEPKFASEFNYDFDCDLYFTGEISPFSAHFLNRQLKEVERYKEQLADKTLLLHLTSDGGCVLSGLKLHDAIASSTLDITVLAEGMVCSAATLLLFAKKAKMTKHSFLLFHELNTYFGLSYSNARAHMDHVDRLMDMVITIYNTKMNPPIEKENLSKDWILDSSKALELGIVDEVIGG